MTEPFSLVEEESSTDLTPFSCVSIRDTDKPTTAHGSLLDGSSSFCSSQDVFHRWELMKRYHPIG